MREDSAEETSNPTTVLALVNAPLAPWTRVLAGEALAWPSTLPVPVDTLVLLALLSEEVLLVFLDAMEEVVMVVFPAVGGNLTLELSVALGLEDISQVEPGLVCLALFKTGNKKNSNRKNKGCARVGVEPVLQHLRSSHFPKT